MLRNNLYSFKFSSLGRVIYFPIYAVPKTRENVAKVLDKVLSYVDRMIVDEYITKVHEVR